MIAITWSSAFKRAFKRYSKKHPDLKQNIVLALEKLHKNPSDPSLNTHLLSGKFDGVWSCSVSYDCRIIFVYKLNDKSKSREIFLINMGTHDEVY